MHEQTQDEANFNHEKEDFLEERDLGLNIEGNSEPSNISKTKNLRRIVLFIAAILVLMVSYFAIGFLTDDSQPDENDVTQSNNVEKGNNYNSCNELYINTERAQCFALGAKILGDSQVCQQDGEKMEVVNYCEKALEKILNKEEKFNDLPIVQECKNIDPWENGSEGFRELDRLSRTCAYGYAIEDTSICEQEDFNYTTKNVVNWRENCFSVVAVETGDYSLCSKLDGIDKENCLENTFYTYYAPNDCDAMRTPYNDYCRNYFGTKLNNESYCNEIDDFALMNECLLKTSNVSRMDEDFYKDDECVKLAYIKYTEDEGESFIYDGKDTQMDINTKMKTFWYDEDTIIFIKDAGKRKYIYKDGLLVGEINPSYEFLQHIIYHKDVLIFNDPNENFVVHKDNKIKIYRNGDFGGYVEDVNDYFQKRSHLIDKYMGGRFWLKNEQEGRVSRNNVPYEKKEYEIEGETVELSVKPLVIDGRKTDIYGSLLGMEQTLGKHLVFGFSYNDEKHIKQNLNTVSSAIFFDGKIIENARDPVLLQCEHNLAIESE